MIREAERKDVQEVLDLLLQVIKKNKWEEQSGMKPDRHTLSALLNYHMRHKDARVFIYEDDEDGAIKGVLAGGLMPFLIDIRRHAAHEKMGGGEKIEKLQEMFDMWAAEENAAVVVRGCYDEPGGSRFRRV